MIGKKGPCVPKGRGRVLSPIVRATTRFPPSHRAETLLSGRWAAVGDTSGPFAGEVVV
jgi:hypothetical protein